MSLEIIAGFIVAAIVGAFGAFFGGARMERNKRARRNLDAMRKKKDIDDEMETQDDTALIRHISRD